MMSSSMLIGGMHPPPTHRTLHLWQPRSRHSCRALTLIELLVVMAILLIVVSLFLGSLSKAKSEALATDCRGRLKQLCTALELYLGDNLSRLPPNRDGLGLEPNWVAGNMGEPDQATNISLLQDSKASLLSAYASDPRCYRCPADRSMNARSVAMNNRLNPARYVGPPRWLGGGGTNYSVYRKSGDVSAPTVIFSFIDESQTTINDGYFAVDMSNTGDLDGLGKAHPFMMIDFPSSLHLSAGTVGFLDGHVECHRWFDNVTLSGKPPGPLGIFVSDHSPDASWIQSHSTQPR